MQKILDLVARLAGLSQVGLSQVGLSQVVSGRAIWNPVRFSGRVALLGGFRGARLVPFAGTAVLAALPAIPVMLALLLPPTPWAMLTGGPARRPALPAAAREATR